MLGRDTARGRLLGKCRVAHAFALVIFKSWGNLESREPLNALTCSLHLLALKFCASPVILPSYAPNT